MGALRVSPDPEHPVPANQPLAGRSLLIWAVILGLAAALACPVSACSIAIKPASSVGTHAGDPTGVWSASCRPLQMRQAPWRGGPMIEQELALESVIACDDGENGLEACTGLAPEYQPVALQPIRSSGSDRRAPDLSEESNS
jgi:hypothetical protein